MSILTTLGSCSGIDTTQLISDLVAAQRETTDLVLTARQTAVEAKISSMSQVSSALSAFSTALNSLVGSGALNRPTPSTGTATLLATPPAAEAAPGISSATQVPQLAPRPPLASAPAPDKNAPLGKAPQTTRLATARRTLPTPPA